MTDLCVYRQYIFIQCLPPDDKYYVFGKMKDWSEKCLHQKINWYMTFQNCNDSSEYVFYCGKPCPYRKYV